MNNNIISINTSEIAPKDERDRRCAAGVKFEGGSCIQLDVLIDLVNAYNLEYSNNKIKLYGHYEILDPIRYKKYLIHQLKNKLNDKSQKTWGNLSFVRKMKDIYREKLQKDTFRPTGPTGKWEWLNTLHIDDVMEQYENKYPDFKYLGTVPIDFDNFERFGIKNLNYSKLINEGKVKYGIVFNLDEHDQPGSHWVALYADVKKGEVYFFDSYGTVPDTRIRKLMRRLARFSQTGMGNKVLKIDYNKKQHQYENSECGVYSINFIVRMLRGDSFKQICESKIPDKQINRCRNVYFGNTKK